MRLSKSTFTAATLLAAITWAGAARAEHFQTRVFHAVANGPTVILAHWTCWFPENCRYAPCHMTTLQEPKLGSVRPSVSPGRVPSDGGACAGKPVPVLNITYTPKANAHGADEVILETHSDNGWGHRIEISVDVP